ncbi:cytochrome b/b6 domain-containing protein [Paracoccus aminovorans]|uniref:cytochrome b/b6 domain-containing protein n=1 Tax=Paracoccus aminovorans TaxID=34004 RepID=UPI0039EB45C2
MTRLLHIGVALSVIWQLLVSLGMEAPRPGQSGNALFETHEYVGLTAFMFITAFWLNLTLRRLGTDPGGLMPWFSAHRRAALMADTRRHLTALRHGRFPAYEEASPLASAVHGLGLLLVTLMAGTGVIWWLGPTGALAGPAIGIHKLFANLVWAYLIAHAGLAVVHHFRRDAPLAEIWSLRK